MACNCLSDLKNSAMEALQKKVSNVPHVEDSLEVSWDNSYLIFQKGDFCNVALKLKSSYRPLKKDNTPAKNLKRLENPVMIKFCPLCGTKFEGKEGDK